MGRFAGQVGYVYYTETSPGVYEEVVEEKTYFGDILRNTRRYEGQSINDNLVLNNQVSILADPFAYSYAPYCKYVKLNNVKWSVTNIELQRPRMLLTLGGVYNGNT